MRSILKTLALALSLTLTLAGCLNQTKAPDIKFAPYGEGYATKPDFAQLEHNYPLTREELGKITPQNLGALDQEQLDQIYGRLTAGPIPDGVYDGTILLPRGVTGKLRIAEVADDVTSGVSGDFASWAIHLKGMKGQKIAQSLWKGKVFFRDERVLRNRIEDLSVLKTAGLVEGEPQKVSVGGKDAWLLFPAKLYCGQSLLDSRRESVIIDYLFTDEIKGYQEKPDYMVGRRGLRIRDEIRMVRPGLYLGRAYADKVFLLNFVLENKEIEKRDRDAFLKTGQVTEDCWLGTQQRYVAGK